MSEDELKQRLTRIEGRLESIREQRATIREYYSTSEVANLLGRAEFTVREWCRLGRVLAEKRVSLSRAELHNSVVAPDNDLGAHLFRFLYDVMAGFEKRLAGLLACQATRLLEIC